MQHLRSNKRGQHRRSGLATDKHAFQQHACGTVSARLDGSRAVYGHLAQQDVHPTWICCAPYEVEAPAAAGSDTSAAAALAAGERLAAAVDRRRACCGSPRAAISWLDRRAMAATLLDAAAGCSGLLARRAHWRAARAARAMHVLIAMELCVLWACAESMVRRRGGASGAGRHTGLAVLLQA